MQLRCFAKAIFSGLIGVLLLTNTTYGQLDEVFSNIFDEVLNAQLKRSPGVHGDHFLEAAAFADSTLTRGLNNLIASNVSSFPLSSTNVGVTFDFSTGRPVSITESLGPIFAETASTLGKGKANIGFNYTYLNFANFRGIPTEDMRFTFTHVDVPDSDPGLGDNLNESDTIDLLLDLDVNASIFAFSATAGLTNNFDIGVAIPIVNVNLSGKAKATVNSFTFANMGVANHHFGADSTKPELVTLIPYDESSTGLGDIALRFKYSFLRGAEVDLAALLDIRLPTGNESDFLGTGKINTKLSWIMAKKIGDFTPNLNIGYERRSSDFDSDEFEFVAGFDQKIATGVTFAIEVLGTIDINKGEAISLFPGEVRIEDQPNSQEPGTSTIRQVDRSNIPERNYDNTFDASFGFRFAPSENVVFLGNILAPLNDGGLRSTVVPSIGLTVIF